MKKYISPCFLLIGVLALAASLFLGYYLVPYKVNKNVSEKSRIVRGNARFQKWEVIPVKLFQKIYLFNVTNPFEVIKGGKPILQQLGPYVYQQKRRKFDIVFNEQNDTIFYKERTDYFFRPDMSGGLESDKLTFINMPYVGTATKAAANTYARALIWETIQSYPEQGLYVNTTVGEVLFNGRYIPFMKDLSELRGEQILPNNTFGFFYGKNGSDAGRFEIYSGVKEPEKFGKVVTWNGMSKLEWWNDEYCNTINGSDGALFPPFSTKETTFNLFIPNLCKSFRFSFEQDEIDVKGIPVIKYSIPPSFFESAKTNPDNRCYCPNPGENYENCPESGIFQMSGCGKGIVLSQPHFYQGSQKFVNQSVGLHPEKELHEMALYIESYTSVPAKVNIRFQMNVELIPNKHFKPLKKIPRMIHPLFWIDQSFEMPEDAAATIREKLYGSVVKAKLISHIGIIVGCALIILSLLFFFLCSPNNTEQDETKLECVSYNPQGTLPNGKIAFDDHAMNGKSTNNHSYYNHQYDKTDSALEASPLLIQNGVLPAKANDQEELSNTQDPNSSTTNHSAYPVSNSSVQQQSPQLVQPISNRHPDSRLSPFPSQTNYSSSLSIAADNTPKELVEATSSYENL